MRSVTTNDRAQGNNGFVPLGCQRATHGDGQLPRPGNPDHIDVVEGGAVTYERIERTVNERSRDVLVEPAGDDGDSPAGADRISGELSHSGREQVSELLALCVEIARVFLSRGRNDRDAILDLESVSLESDQLPRIVRQRTDSLQSEIEQDLRANSIVAKIGLEPELLVRFDGVRARVLKLVRLELVEEADSPSFLVEVDDCATTLFRDHAHRRVQLPSAVTPQ